MFHPTYRKATWIALILIIFHELTGINAILIYSNVMLKNMSKDGSGLSPRVGTCLIGTACFVFAVVSLYSVGRFKRRQLLWPGHLLMALCHILVGICAIFNMSGLVLTFMIGFIAFYEVMNGSVCWVYTSEVVVDVALGLCIGILYGVVLILSLTINFLMNSALKPQGVFFLFGGISLLGAAFCYFFIKET
jgi:SP family arabinose:H+ symporter-like MFS transporter